MLPLNPFELRSRVLKDDRFPTAGESEYAGESIGW
jgi:hypothetical protein